METTIGYLNQVHGDLLGAARRERERGPAPGRSPGGHRFPTALVAGAAAVIVLAGVIGALSRSGGFGGDDAAGGATPASGEAGSTGATGGAQYSIDEGQNFDAVTAPLPEASPPPGHQAPSDVGPPQLSRVIRTAELSIVVPRDEFDRRFGEAVDAAESNGGYVQDSRTRSRAGTLTIRVPADNFDETLRAVRGLGTVEVESIRGRDVTAEYVDLRARLRIGKSRREVLLRLMGKAVSIEQTIRVQNALDETQLRIEQIQGQLRLLDDRTSLATITLNLREQGVNAEVPTASIPNAFDRSVAGFVGVVAAIVIGLGYLLPLLIIGLACWFVWTRIQRRREAR
jgi:uncharacterized protein DUF4349